MGILFCKADGSGPCHWWWQVEWLGFSSLTAATPPQSLARNQNPASRHCRLRPPKISISPPNTPVSSTLLLYRWTNQMQRHYLTCAPPYRCYRARLRCWQMTYARRFHFYIYKMERLYMYNLPVYLFCACISMLSCFSHVQFFATPWTVVHQASLSMDFSSQEYWNRLPFPPPGDLPNPGIEPSSLSSPALAGGFFTASDTWEAHVHNIHVYIGKRLCGSWDDQGS